LPGFRIRGSLVFLSLLFAAMSLQVLPQFRVVDESDDWLVVDKAAPLIVHPTNRKDEPTLLGGVEQLLAFDIENGAKPAVVNRLDRDTSGLVIVAKHREAAGELGRRMENREVHKEYLAVAHGSPEADCWECAEPIRRAGITRESKIWVRQIVDPEGKPCLTRFQVLQRFERETKPFVLLRCLPETGRMHQIRVHLAHVGHPIVGDKLYSGDGSEYIEWMAEGWTDSLQQRLHLPRQALHASRLQLQWQGRDFDWQAEMPHDLRDFMAGLPYRQPPAVMEWSREA